MFRLPLTAYRFPFGPSAASFPREKLGLAHSGRRLRGVGMKRPWLLPALSGLELILAVVLAALCALHIYYTVLNNRQARRLYEYNINRQAFGALVRESVAYGTLSNRAVLQALSDAGVQLNLSSNAPVQPKPAPVKGNR